jgi:broad specificity phosphatase PhoE
MKEIHIRRHAEKNSDGTLTENGVQRALELSKHMPEFAKVIASDSNRTQLTAKLLTGVDPLVDARVGYSMISPEKIDAIEQISLEHKISFFEAVDRYRDMEILKGIETKADTLNQFIDEQLDELEENKKILIVSHEITIVPAMTKRGISLQSINPLGGFALRADGSIESIK